MKFDIKGEFRKPRDRDDSILQAPYSNEAGKVKGYYDALRQERVSLSVLRQMSKSTKGKRSISLSNPVFHAPATSKPTQRK